MNNKNINLNEITAEQADRLWAMLSDDQKAEIVVILAARQYNETQARGQNSGAAETAAMEGMG